MLLLSPWDGEICRAQTTSKFGGNVGDRNCMVLWDTYRCWNARKKIQANWSGLNSAPNERWLQLVNTAAVIGGTREHSTQPSCYADTQLQIGMLIQDLLAWEHNPLSSWLPGRAVISDFEHDHLSHMLLPSIVFPLLSQSLDAWASRSFNASWLCPPGLCKARSERWLALH